MLMELGIMMNEEGRKGQRKRDRNMSAALKCDHPDLIAEDTTATKNKNISELQEAWENNARASSKVKVNRGWSDYIINSRKEERLNNAKRKIDNAIMNKRIRSLKDYEVEDIAYYFTKALLKKQYERTNKIYANGKWSYNGTLKYGHNKINFFTDNDEVKHIVVAGGRHNVNFTIENPQIFTLRFLKFLGYKIYKDKRGSYRVNIVKKLGIKKHVIE
jgi:hypothetical protein